jgi:hypothetical protein
MRRGDGRGRRKTLHGARRTQRRGLSPPVSHSHERTFPDISVYTHTDPGSVTYCHSNDVPLACLYIVCANGLHVPVRSCVRRVLLTRPTGIHNNSPPSLFCIYSVMPRLSGRLSGCNICPVEGLRGSLHMITIAVTHDCMIIACLLTSLLTCLFNYMHSSSQVPAVSCLLLAYSRSTGRQLIRHRVTTPFGTR